MLRSSSASASASSSTTSNSTSKSTKTKELHELSSSTRKGRQDVVDKEKENSQKIKTKAPQENMDEYAKEKEGEEEERLKYGELVVLGEVFLFFICLLFLLVLFDRFLYITWIFYILTNNWTNIYNIKYQHVQNLILYKSMQRCVIPWKKAGITITSTITLI